MQPVLLLRESVKNGTQVTYDATAKEIVFPNGQRFSKDMPTNLKGKKGKGEPYSLGALWFFTESFIKNTERVEFAVYITESSNLAVPIVSLVDKNDFTRWFKGTVDTIPALGEVVPFDPLPAEPEERPTKRPRLEPKESETDMDAKTDANKDSGITDSDVGGISSASLFPEEDDVTPDVMRRSGHISSPSGGGIFETEVGSDRAERLRNIMAMEKPLKTPESLLQVPNKKLEKLFGNGRHPIDRSARAKLSTTPAGRSSRGATTDRRFNSGDQTEFWDSVSQNTDVTKKFNTKGSFLNSSQPSRPASEQPPPESHSRPGSAQKRPHPSSQRNATTTTTPSRSLRSPIVIVPRSSRVATSTGLISMANIHALLVESRFVDPSQCEAPAQSVHLTRNMGKLGEIKLRVVDNPTNFKAADWDNVVAIFVQGPEWQFKQWPFDSPATIFSRFKGFYVHFDDEKVAENVLKWNVKRLPIHKTKRHLDVSAAEKFWSEVLGVVSARQTR